jgi:methyl-accepting chemotaxis protein
MPRLKRRERKQGRGFAVVAHAAQRLPEHSMTATKEIAQIVEAVQKETAMTVEQMEASLEKIIYVNERKYQNSRKDRALKV